MIKKYLNKIINDDHVEFLSKFPKESIDLVITSPPYDNLRDYDGYRFNFWELGFQLIRTLKQGGVIVWVVGDATINGSETGTSFRQALYFKDAGLRLHDTMIYRKNNFSNPSTVRYPQVFEYMFVFSKGRPKTFNPIKDRKNKYFGQTSWGRNTVRQKDGSLKERPKKVIAEYGMRYNIWKYNVGKGFSAKGDTAYEHPAIFPEQLARDHIISWSNPSDIVLDPMCGSGTTCLAAKQLGRDYIGIDISEKYCDIAQRRINEQNS